MAIRHASGSKSEAARLDGTQRRHDATRLCGLLIVSDPRSQSSDLHIYLDGEDVTRRCFAADDRENWVALYRSADDRHPYLDDNGRIAAELQTGEVRIVGAYGFSMAMLLEQVVAEARRMERAAIEQRLTPTATSLVGGAYRDVLIDLVWDRGDLRVTGP